MRKLSLVLASLLAVAFSFATMPAKEGSHAMEACLITKTDINPFFVKMKEGAEARAHALGVKLSFLAGKIDGDHETQVRAVETCIASGAKGILIAASDTKAIVPVLKNAQDNGLLVIALDTPLEPITAADSTFATDNFKAGELGGAWVAAKLGADAANAKIAMLDLNESQPSVGVLRDQGFLTGFGIDVKDVSKWGDEDDPRIICNEVTNGNDEGGRTAMEKGLQSDQDIKVLYKNNGPGSVDANVECRGIGKDDCRRLIASVDGACPGLAGVESCICGGSSQQYPLLMASGGVESIKARAEDGTKPENTPGLDFYNTGVNLVTDNAAAGVESISVKEGMDRCWG